MDLVCMSNGGFRAWPLTWLCVCAPQTYGIGGESLRNLTEKLRTVSHTLQMGIQSRWRINGYNGGSTTKLSAGVLQLVVELIISAKGLFSLLNRWADGELSNSYMCTTPASIFSTVQEMCSHKNSRWRFCCCRFHVKRIMWDCFWGMLCRRSNLQKQIHTCFHEPYHNWCVVKPQHPVSTWTHCCSSRYQFFQLTEGAISKTIFTYCKELGDIVHKVGPLLL